MPVSCSNISGEVEKRFSIPPQDPDKFQPIFNPRVFGVTSVGRETVRPCVMRRLLAMSLSLSFLFSAPERPPTLL